MRFKVWSPKIFSVLIFFILISGMSNSYAESTFSAIKDKIKEEINRGKTQFKEELQRALEQSDKKTNAEYKSVVPYLIGRTPQEAEYILPEYSLVLGRVIDQESDQAVGTIISQSHKPNSEVQQQTEISVEVAIARSHSQPDTLLTVPNLQGMSLSKAKEQLNQSGFTLGSIQERVSDLSKGLVIGQKPTSGARLKRNNKINLIIAKEKVAQAGPKLSLILDKSSINTTESILMRAVIDPQSNDALEYSFTIDGKVYASSSNQLSHSFTKAGKVIITASVRKKRGKWLHSKSQWLVIKDQKDTSSSKTDSDSVAVPNVIGLSMQEAEALLAKSKLSIGEILQEKSLGKPRILKQQPDEGVVVREGSKIQLTESIEYDVALSLSASRSQIKQHESIDFEVAIPTESPTEDFNYRLLINNQVLESDKPNWTFNFDQAGEYRVIAEAQTSSGETYRSPEVRVQVSRVWDEPRAIIEPSSLVILKGDTATFSSQSTHDKNSDITLFWMDENGGSDTGKRYSIDTKSWDVGEYWVSLRIKDEQGFEHSNKAELIITDNLKSLEDETPASKDHVPQITANDIQLSLAASSYHVVENKPLQFTITQHPATQSEYRVIFGDGNEKKSAKPWVEHIYSKLGKQTAFVEIDYQQNRVQSQQITIWVWPSWLLIAITIIGLLMLLGLLKRLKPQKTSKLNKTNRSVRYSPVIDAGEQNMDSNKSPQQEKSHLRFEAEVDEGKQWIAYSKQTKDK